MCTTTFLESCPSYWDLSANYVPSLFRRHSFVFYPTAEMWVCSACQAWIKNECPLACMARLTQQ
jgi:hypothetical protein